ncbi:RNA polymerase sigma factor [Methyloglobulus sp.]|uniref:RNA polymerase sigma factor n=1 Tax=Methyloglobulus sp. TaxID=2518622 RepID=UPI0032B7D204
MNVIVWSDDCLRGYCCLSGVLCGYLKLFVNMVSGSQTFGHFFLETKEELQRFFLQRFNCPDTAADLAQETYARVLSCEQKETSQSRRALAFSIAGNLAVDHLRKQRVRSRFSLPQEDNESALEAALCTNLHSEQKLMAWQDLEQLEASLEELPEECRVALFLSAVEGLTYVQIGERLGISERMVAKRIAKTLKYCQARRDEGDNDGC